MGEVGLLLLLERRGMEQTQLARLLGVHPSQVSRWISGERPMPLRRRMQAARILADPALATADEDVRRVVDLGIVRQTRAIANGEPLRVSGEMWIYPDGRHAFVPQEGPDGPGGASIAA